VSLSKHDLWVLSYLPRILFVRAGGESAPYTLCPSQAACQQRDSLSLLQHRQRLYPFQRDGPYPYAHARLAAGGCCGRQAGTVTVAWKVRWRRWQRPLPLAERVPWEPPPARGMHLLPCPMHTTSLDGALMFCLVPCAQHQPDDIVRFSAVPVIQRDDVTLAQRFAHRLDPSFCITLARSRLSIPFPKIVARSFGLFCGCLGYVRKALTWTVCQHPYRIKEKNSTESPCLENLKLLQVCHVDFATLGGSIACGQMICCQIFAVCQTMWYLIVLQWCSCVWTMAQQLGTE
jgi:hypothetical protein